MLLRGMLENLFARGVVLLATSNCAPGALYENGLQRRRFLPAIELIEARLRVLALNTGVDHRRRLLQRAGTYHTPSDDRARPPPGSAGAFRPPSARARGATLTVNDRPVQTVQLSDNVAWFSFAALCGTARTASDYIQIACDYPAVLLSDIPQLNGRDDDARRFIHLIDVLYDHRVKLIAAAAAPALSLYQKGRLGREFERTASRLTEMGSSKYLSSRHRQHDK